MALNFRGVQLPRGATAEQIAQAFATIQRAFDQLQQDLAALSSDKAIGGVVVPGVVFASGQSTQVSHGLGRNWVGWQIVNKTGYADVKADVAQPFPDRALFLTANANVVADVRVF